MKLSQKQISKLESILDSVVQANEKLYSKDTAFCLRRNMATTTLDYVNPQGQALIDIEREYGTKICYYKDVEKMLRSFIENKGQDVKVLMEG